MTPFFSSTFSALFVGNILFCIWNTQNSFSCDSPFCPSWSVKFLNIGQKQPIWTSHQVGVPKDAYFVFVTEGSQKRYQPIYGWIKFDKIVIFLSYLFSSNIPFPSWRTVIGFGLKLCFYFFTDSIIALFLVYIQFAEKMNHWFLSL